MPEIYKRRRKVLRFLGVVLSEIFDQLHLPVGGLQVVVQAAAYGINEIFFLCQRIAFLVQPVELGGLQRL